MECATLLSVAASLLLAVPLILWVSRLWHQPDSLHAGVVIITGGAGGLGCALAHEFLRLGAAVELWDVRAAALDEVCARLRNTPGVSSAAVHARLVDVADAESVAAAAKASIAAHGEPRVVVNNAAVVYGDGVLGGTAQRLQRAIGVNILGYFWVVRAFVPLLAASRRRCAVVTIGSVMAHLPAARLADYCASKAAVAQLHACLRLELATLP